MFLAMPFASHRLGAAYDAFSGLTQIGWIIGVVNLGVGPGLTMELTRYAVDGDEKQEREWFAMSFWLGLASSTIVLLLLLLVALFVPMTAVFGQNLAPYSADLQRGMLLFSVLAFVQASLSTFAQAYSGYLEDYKAKLPMTVGYGLSIPAIIATSIWAPQPSWLAVAVHGPPILCQVYNVFRLFKERGYLWPKFSHLVREKAPSIWHNNVMSSLIAVGTLATKQVLVLVVGHYGRKYETGMMSTAVSWFFMAGTVFVMVAGAAWPSISNAYKANDWVWLRRATNRLLALHGLAGVAAGLVVALAGPFVSKLLYEENFVLRPSTCAWLGLAIAVSSFEIGLSQYFLAFDKMRRAAAVGIVQAIAASVAGVLMVRANGLDGAVAAMAVAESAYVVTAVIALYRPVIRQLYAAPQA